MQNVINGLCETENFKEELRKACRTNGISITLLNGLTISKLKTISNRTLQHYESNPEKAKNSWFQNQLRLFHWLLIIESFRSGVLINQFDNLNWQNLQAIFPPKPLILFQYETKKLIYGDSPQNSRNWDLEQCELLIRLMGEQGLMNRWNQVARRFYQQSGKRFFRSSKQCRQQWFNHLDNSKIHGQWKQTEDHHILEYVYKHGHKWAQLCKQFLPHRTQHMIKNRFKSLLMKTNRQTKGKITQRKKIKLLLQDRSLGNENKMLKEEQLIKKQATSSTQKKQRMEEENQSFQLGQDINIEKNEQIMPSDENIVIGKNEKKQKQSSQRRDPIKPTPCIQPFFPTTRSLEQPGLMMNPMFEAPSYPSPHLTFFSTFAPCFTFFPSNLAPLGNEQDEEKKENRRN